MGAWPVEFQNNLPSIFVKTYDVPNEEIRVLFWNGDAGPRNYAVDIYLIR
jgi:hypothetical protein